MKIYLQNTLTKNKEVFESIDSGETRVYHCGPTLYDRQHIGNLSMFVFTDILRRTLEYAGFKVKQVINFTDFGHLSLDNEGRPDEGEDRMTKGLRREGMEPSLPNMRILAEKYAAIFQSDLALLNIETRDTLFPYASDYIPDQIKLIETLLEKGYAYTGENGVYYDTSKFPQYGKLGNINLEGLKEGARVKEDNDKINLTDFVLWKSDPKIGWPSPWGIGFPGWHIECSAMIIKLLGEQIDIHTGGVEHISIHHNNEIAQSEAATGKEPFSRFWLHRAHLKIDGGKMSKSTGSVVYLDDLIKRKIHPLSLRYLLLSSHYSSAANFTWEAVLAAQNALERIVDSYLDLPKEEEGEEKEKKILESFESAVSDDLNTPIALAILQKAGSKNVVDEMDKILGLNIKKLSGEISNIPEEVLQAKDERDRAREEKDWQKSDQLRSEIESQGFLLEDKESGSKIKKKFSSLI